VHSTSSVANFVVTKINIFTSCDCFLICLNYAPRKFFADHSNPFRAQLKPLRRDHSSSASGVNEVQHLTSAGFAEFRPLFDPIPASTTIGRQPKSRHWSKICRVRERLPAAKPQRAPRRAASSVIRHCRVSRNQRTIFLFFD
jgi:hypothetical protein